MYFLYRCKKNLRKSVSWWIRFWSDQNNSDFFWFDLLNSPVIKIVVQVAVSYHELEFLEELFILVNIKCIEHIVVLVFSKYKCICHQLCDRVSVRNKVVWVRHVQDLVSFMSQYRAWKAIETNEVSDLVRFQIFNYETFNDVFSWNKEVTNFIFSKLNV